MVEVRLSWVCGAVQAVRLEQRFDFEVMGGFMRTVRMLAGVAGLGLVAMALLGRTRGAAVTNALDSLHGLEAVNGKAEITTYRGRRALHLLGWPEQATPDHPANDASMLAIVTGMDFHNGTIQLEVAGAPRAGAPEDSRGFIGIVFRAQDRGARGENIYLRPTNGRADDQLRRNHSTQYESIPDFRWHRLRKESPGVYESYADLDPGAWTKMKIVVSGTKAQLFVNGADQPALIVNDLKLGETHGQIGLWAHKTTEAYFSSLTVK